MQNKTLTILLLAVGTACISLSCNKDKLTAATQKGANTFSCKIDGTVFLPSEDGSSWSGAHPILVNNSSFNGFVLQGRKFSTSSTSDPVNVLIEMPYLKTTGSYTLTTYGYGEYKVDYFGAPTYRTNNTYSGTVNITRCDTVNRIYSGIFSFKGIDDNTGKVVDVTDGRFDVKTH